MNHNACTLTIMYGRKTNFLGSKSKMSYAAFDKAARRYPLAPSMITRPDLSLNRTLLGGRQPSSLAFV